jgi:hypothetical protein
MTPSLQLRQRQPSGVLGPPQTPHYLPVGHWPYCIACGADELYCLRHDLGETGLVTGDELACYLCGSRWVAVVV